MPATQAPPTSAPASQPSAPKAGPSAVPVGNMPTPPVATDKPVDAPTKAGDFSGFDKYAKSPEEGLTLPGSKTPKPPEAPKTEQPKEEPKTEEQEPIEDEGDDDLLGEGKPKKAEAKPEAAKVDGKDGKKVSPWKLVDEHKAARLKAEAEVANLRKLIPNETEATARSQEYESLKKQNQELLDHMRYLDYQKHPEFQEKYQKPYEGKFNQIMNRLRGAKIATEDGTGRPVTTDDIVKLGSLNAMDLMDQSEKQFGKLGTWVAERVEELTQLWQDKEQARETAKTEGGKVAQQFEAQSKELSKFLHETYTKSLADIESHSKHGKYFKEVEGDEDWNSRLENGTKFVDENWQKDPRDPKLSQDDRAKIVKAHAAIRNRARAWSVQNLTIQRQEAEIARLSQELKQYSDSTPTIEGQRQESNGRPANGNALDSVFAGIEKFARPGVV